jgi:hypothetical protein
MVVAALLVAASIGAMASPARDQPARADGPAPGANGPQVVLPDLDPAIGADGNTPPTAPAPPSVGAARTAPDGGITIEPVASVGGIPASVLAGYRQAAETVGRAQPVCHLPMTLLAAIGKVESGHARGGQVDARGTTVRAILGPALDGRPGMATIGDTDGGRLDGDPRWDRAVGPMQFIPGTWARWATDGNADGVASPHNIHDASSSSGRYLCANGRDLATESGLRSGILSYNRSDTYLRFILAWMATYDRGTFAVPDATAPSPAPPRTGVPATPTEQPPSQQPPATTVPPPPPGGPPPPDGPNPPPSSTPAPRPAPTEPGAPAPPPPAVGPVAGVVCLIDIVTGLVGGLIGLPIASPPPPTCEPPAPATPGG